MVDVVYTGPYDRDMETEIELYATEFTEEIKDGKVLDAKVVVDVKAYMSKDNPPNQIVMGTYNSRSWIFYFLRQDGDIIIVESSSVPRSFIKQNFVGYIQYRFGREKAAVNTPLLEKICEERGIK